jgi:integrase/recombinase XerD
VIHAFSSCYKRYLEGLVEQKRALGYPYLESERVLYTFDTFCREQFPNESVLTREIGQAWAVIRVGEKPSSFQNRMAPVRELARYINRLGLEAYVIPYDFGPRYARRYIPHIFTDTELKRFFAAADNMVENSRCRLRHLAVPVIFRLMYCCGLRPHEARLIQRQDFDLSAGELKVPESKGHKDRLVMVAPDVASLCRRYAEQAEIEFPDSVYFFPCQRTKGGCYAADWLRDVFDICWTASGIGGYTGNKPRPYDFRHTFATNRIYQWLHDGKSVESLLPYLSSYMGHSKFSHTAYYIHLVPQFFPHMAKMDFAKYEKLLPEVLPDEA